MLSGSYTNIIELTLGALPLKYTDFRLSHSPNAPSEILVTLLGIVTLVRLQQSANAPPNHPHLFFPMLVTLLGIVTLVRPMQLSNAPSPMLVTLLGIVTLVRLVHEENAPLPTLATGKPSRVSGMVTTPIKPVYLVMVIVPLLVV